MNRGPYRRDARGRFAFSGGNVRSNTRSWLRKYGAQLNVELAKRGLGPQYRVKIPRSRRSR